MKKLRAREEQAGETNTQTKELRELVRIPHHSRDLPSSFPSSLPFCMANLSLGHHLPSKAIPHSLAGCSISLVFQSSLPRSPQEDYSIPTATKKVSAASILLKKENQFTMFLSYISSNTFRMSVTRGTMLTTDLPSFLSPLTKTVIEIFNESK